MASIDLGGLRALAVDLRAVPRKADVEVRAITQAAAEMIKRDAQTLCPVDTGFLKGSIGYETKVLAGGVVAEIGPTAHYGGYVEEGTSRMAPQPYLAPAWDRNVPSWVAALEQFAGRSL